MSKRGLEFTKAFRAILGFGLVLSLLGGCTDRGRGPFGAGPDDRTDRGGGPDTLTVIPTADTYFERTIEDGKYLLFGRLNAQGFEAVSFVTFGSLPASAEGLEEVTFVLHVAADKPPYSFQVSRLEEPAPSEYPFWPGPPDGANVVEVRGATAIKDTLAPLEGYYYLEVEIPPNWVAGWIEDPSTNLGVRISGGTLDVSGGGQVERRYYGGGQKIDGYELSPKLEISRSGQGSTTHVSTSEFYIFNPSIGPVGEQPYLRVGSVYGYEALLRFPLDQFPDDSSVNKAQLFLKVDRSEPDLNDGIFDVLVRPVLGAWKDDSTNVNVQLDPASTVKVEIEAVAGGSSTIEIDVTALVDVFAEGGFINLAVQRTGTFSHSDKVALVSSETLGLGDAPLLRVVFTTPPGRRY